MPYHYLAGIEAWKQASWINLQISLEDRASRDKEEPFEEEDPLAGVIFPLDRCIVHRNDKGDVIDPQIGKAFPDGGFQVGGSKKDPGQYPDLDTQLDWVFKAWDRQDRSLAVRPIRHLETEFGLNKPGESPEAELEAWLEDRDDLAEWIEGQAWKDLKRTLTYTRAPSFRVDQALRGVDRMMAKRVPVRVQQRRLDEALRRIGHYVSRQPSRNTGMSGWDWLYLNLRSIESARHFSAEFRDRREQGKPEDWGANHAPFELQEEDPRVLLQREYYSMDRMMQSMANRVKEAQNERERENEDYLAALMEV